MKNPDKPVYHKAVPFESPLGERVLSDLAIRYPHFKPGYIGQDHIYDGVPDMVGAYALGPEDVRVDIINKDVSLPEDLYDIAGVLYILVGGVLTFTKAYTNYDFLTSQQPQIRPDLREFYEFYLQLKQSAPDIVAMIEHFATIYEKQIAGYNGTYEPLALRELLWNFGKVLSESLVQT
jgi:hypothetical protein